MYSLLNLSNRLSFILILICIFPTTTLVYAQAPAKFNVLILTGVNNHDWRATTPVLRQILESTGIFDAHVNEEGRGCGPETFAPYDLLVLNYNDWKNSGPWWDNRARQAMLDFVRNGKGIVFYHAANNAFWGWPEYDKLVGGTWRETAGHSPSHAYTLKIIDTGHPITKGLPSSFPVTDELYNGLSLQPNIHILATAWDDPAICRSPGERCGTGKDEPLIWVQNYGAGRVFQTALGHDTKAMQNRGFQITLQRGAEWAATGRVTVPVPADLK
jgi:type 1 glutamine amidotransferase